MAIILHKKTLTFDDVLLVPQYSEIDSRSEIDTSTKIGGLKLRVPIISANMDTITGVEMAEAMGQSGGAGILHRYQKADQVVSSLRLLKEVGEPGIPSVGVQVDDKAKARTYRDFTRHICVDVAHGDTKATMEMVDFLRNTLGYDTVIAGNVVTLEAAKRLEKAGANVIKVGVGPGSVCTTRSVTGHGYPQFSAIMEIAGAGCYDVIADGGLKNSGDIVKALGAGAAAVMTGSLFAGCPETLGGTEYRGMASPEAQIEFRGRISNRMAEGVAVKVPVKSPVAVVMAELAGGVRSGFSYSGARNLQEFQECATFVKVSPNTTVENGIRWPQR